MNELIILSATYLYLLIALIAGITWLVSTAPIKTNILKLSLLSFPVSYILAQISALIYYDPRPFVVEHVQPLIAHGADNGFPSDHTLLSMTIAAVVFVYSRRTGYVLFIMAAMVGVARVIAKVHHPVDVWGSTLIALIAIVIAWSMLQKVRPLDDFLSSFLAKLVSKLPHFS